VFSILIVFESLGFEVKTFLAGLGIGGLAVALAAQDTLANLFGSFVVLVDQPFYVGEYIRVGTDEGTVEEIGLRSTRLRTASAGPDRHPEQDRRLRGDHEPDADAPAPGGPHGRGAPTARRRRR
jgi:small-conductance mechanosensitive channel